MNRPGFPHVLRRPEAKERTDKVRSDMAEISEQAWLYSKL